MNRPVPAETKSDGSTTMDNRGRRRKLVNTNTVPLARIDGKIDARFRRDRRECVPCRIHEPRSAASAAAERTPGHSSRRP